MHTLYAHVKHRPRLARSVSLTGLAFLSCARLASFCSSSLVVPVRFVLFIFLFLFWLLCPALAPPSSFSSSSSSAFSSFPSFSVLLPPFPRLGHPVPPLSSVILHANMSAPTTSASFSPTPPDRIGRHAKSKARALAKRTSQHDARMMVRRAAVRELNVLAQHVGAAPLFVHVGIRRS